MNVLKTSSATLFLVLAAHTSASFSASVGHVTPDVTNVALGYCLMNDYVGLGRTRGSINFPDGTFEYDLTNCSDVLKKAADKGYVTIISSTASNNSLSPIANFVIASDSEPKKSTAVMFCPPDPLEQQIGTVDYNSGEHDWKTCAAILHDLKVAGYSIVPELVATTDGQPSSAAYVFTKK